MRISDWSSDVCSSDLFRNRWASACRRRRSRYSIGTASRPLSAPSARDGADGRPGGGSGSGLAELLAQPVVDQALLVAQLVAVGQRRTALQVGDIGQLARTLRKYVAIGDRKSTRLNSVTNAHLVCRLLLEKKHAT